jgi:hypothetical protein
MGRAHNSINSHLFIFTVLVKTGCILVVTGAATGLMPVPAAWWLNSKCICGWDH